MILYEMLKKSTEMYPDKVALIYQKEEITYKDLLYCVNKTQQQFQKLGIQPGKHIGLVLHNSIEYVICLYALSKNGNVVCLLNPQWCIKELERKFQSAILDGIVVESYIYKRIKKECEHLLDKYFILQKASCVSKDIMEKKLFDLEENISFMDETLPALIQSSSGTTSLSKMAYRSHKNIDLDSVNIIEIMEYKTEDIFFVPVPLCHGYGLTMGLIAPIRCGATIYIQRWFDCNDFINSYHKLKPNIFLGVPEIYDCIYSELKGNLFDFKYNKWFLCSGSPLHWKTGENFNKISKLWINQVYGMMEVSTICVNKEVDKENLLSVGKPVKNIQIQYKSTSEENQFEILVRGETVSKNYIENGEIYLAVDKEEWFSTNDIGYVNNNNLFLIGRKGGKSNEN